MGSLAATPMAFVLPCGFHMTLVAKNWCQKGLDIFIMILGVIYMFGGTVYTIITWNN